MEHLWLREAVAETEYEVLNNKHDKGYKYLLSVKKVFVELLRSFVKQDWVDSIEENNAPKKSRIDIDESLSSMQMPFEALYRALLIVINYLVQIHYPAMFQFQVQIRAEALRLQLRL